MSLITHDYHCQECDIYYESETVERDDRDKFTCAKCGKVARRLLSAPTISKFSAPLSASEKGIKADLQAANRIERDLAYGTLKADDAKSKAEISKELVRRKFT